MFKLFASVTVLAASLLSVTAAHADPVGGPCVLTSRLQAYSSESFTIDCWGGEWTEIKIHGDGDTDLDLYVFDAFGNLIGSYESYSDQETALVLPNFRQQIIVKVVNRGNVYNQYVITAR